MKRAICAACIGWVVATGCGGTSGPQETAMDLFSARASLDEVSEISATMSAMPPTASGDAVVEVTALMAAHQSLVFSGGAVGSLLGEVYEFPRSAGPSPTPDGSASCTEAACTFTRYGLTFPPYDAYHVDGSVTRSGDLLAFHVTYEQVQTHTGVIAWTLDGSLSTARGALDGSLHDHGVGSGAFDGVSWDVAVDYQGIGLDPHGCPTRGTLHAVTRYDATASQQRGDSPPTLARQASAAFGAGCDDVATESR